MRPVELDPRASPAVSARSRIGWAQPPVEQMRVDGDARPFATARFALGVIVGTLVPFALLSMLRTGFRIGRALTPRVAQLLISRALMNWDGRRVAWRTALLVRQRRSQAGVWLLWLLLGGRLIARARQRGEGATPGWLHAWVRVRLARLRAALRADVMVVDQDARLPRVSAGLAARAYVNWGHLQLLLDPPTWQRPDVRLHVDLVARWAGDRPAELAELLADLAGQSYRAMSLVLVLEGDARVPDDLVARYAGWLRIARAGTTVDDACSGGEGDLVGVVDVHDRIPRDALAELTGALAAQPTSDAVYADEDWLGPRGPFLPHLKAELAPDTQRSTGYIGRPWLVRRARFAAVGGLAETVHGHAAEYALMLRLIESGAVLAHVPRVLYRWRLDAMPPRDDEAFARALALHLDRSRGGGTVEPGLAPGLLRARPRLHTRPTVSIVVPNRDQPTRLAACLASITRHTTYAHREVVVVENNSTDPATRACYRDLERDALARVIAIDQPRFNFSVLVNAGVAASSGEVVVLLNNDTEVLQAEWIEAMLEHAMQPDVGAVGARLLYPSGTVQHAGVVLGPGGLGGHVHRGSPRVARGYARRLVAVHDVSAVTAACLMTRRSVWDALGGFDTVLGVAYNDVDYCLRARRRGLRVVQTPHAELVHHEHASRGRSLEGVERERDEREAATFRARWRASIDRDPFLPRDFAAAWLLCAAE